MRTRSETSSYTIRYNIQRALKSGGGGFVRASCSRAHRSHDCKLGNTLLRNYCELDSISHIRSMPIASTRRQYVMGDPTPMYSEFSQMFVFPFSMKKSGLTQEANARRSHLALLTCYCHFSQHEHDTQPQNQSSHRFSPTE